MTYQPSEMETRIISKAMEDKAFKHELMSNPKAVIARESGQEWPDNVDIEVLEQTPAKLYLVLPLNLEALASAGGELSEQQLEAVAGGATPTVAATPWTPAIGGALGGAGAVIGAAILDD